MARFLAQTEQVASTFSLQSSMAPLANDSGCRLRELQNGTTHQIWQSMPGATSSVSASPKALCTEKTHPWSNPLSRSATAPTEASSGECSSPEVPRLARIRSPQLPTTWFLWWEPMMNKIRTGLTQCASSSEKSHPRPVKRSGRSNGARPTSRLTPIA